MKAPTKKDARIAGLLYLIAVISGVVSLIYMPTKFIVWENGYETYNNVIAYETIFKLGVVSDIVLYTSFVFLSFALYKLLKGTNEAIAKIMVILVLISVAISFANLTNKLDVLSLVHGPDELSIKYKSILTLFESHNNGVLISEIFWGLWLFPFGLLVYHFDKIPKIMGIFLMLACLGYLVDFFGYFFLPDSFGKTSIPTLMSVFQALGEMGICLWLLIIGIKE